LEAGRTKPAESKAKKTPKDVSEGDRSNGKNNGKTETKNTTRTMLPRGRFFREECF